MEEDIRSILQLLVGPDLECGCQRLPVESDGTGIEGGAEMNKVNVAPLYEGAQCM